MDEPGSFSAYAAPKTPALPANAPWCFNDVCVDKNVAVASEKRVPGQALWSFALVKTSGIWFPALAVNSLLKAGNRGLNVDSLLCAPQADFAVGAAQFPGSTRSGPCASPAAMPAHNGVSHPICAQAQHTAGLEADDSMLANVGISPRSWFIPGSVTI
jgi:hypothetical protein